MSNKENKQDYANNQLCIINNTLKNILGANLEYMSALIYVMYKYRDIKFKDCNSLELIKIIDSYIQDLNETDEKLFRNIRFINLINESNIKAFRNVVMQLDNLINYIEDEKMILAEAYENLITISVQNNENIFNNGEFYTPKEIVKTMVNLIDVKEDMTVYNPFSYSGAFLIESAKIANAKMYGEEKSSGIYNICKTNLWLNDTEEVEIMEDNLKYFKADFVITNPPFADNMNGKDSHLLSIYSKFLVKMIDSVNEYGKIAIVLPHGFLFKKSDKYVRNKLIERNWIDSIIALPENLFYRTRIPVIILLLDKNRKKSNILFIDASNEFVSRRKVNYLSQESQDKIISTYREYKQVENYSYLSSIEEIRKNDYDLSIKKYVQIHKKMETIDKEKVERQIYELEEQRYKINQEINKLIKNMKE